MTQEEGVTIGGREGVSKFLDCGSVEIATSGGTTRRRFLTGVGCNIAIAGSMRGRSVAGFTDRNSMDEPGSAVVIDPPLRGEWMVLNPPGHPTLADDFIGMQTGRRLPYSVTALPRHLFTSVPVTRAYGWNRPVYAPISGTVIEVSNDEPDARRINLIGDAISTLAAPPEIEGGDIRPAAGNYVIIESPNGYVLLAHLRRGSIPVSEGTSVVAGDLLGTVGNSGASAFPHLHLHMMDMWPHELTDVEAHLLPYRFSSYERFERNFFREDSWNRVAHSRPGQRERFRVCPSASAE